jgi:hypothetical protein
VADAGHPNTTLTLKESVALVRYFNGVLCAPAAKIDIPRGRDVWLMLFSPVDVNPRIDILSLYWWLRKPPSARLSQQAKKVSDTA